MPAVDIWLAAKPAASRDDRGELDAKCSGDTATGGDFDQVMQATLAPHAQKPVARNSIHNGTSSTPDKSSPASAPAVSSHAEKPAEKVSQKKNNDQTEAATPAETKVSTQPHLPVPIDSTELTPVFLSLPLFLSGSFSDPVNVPTKAVKSETETRIAVVSSATEKAQTSTASSSASKTIEGSAPSISQSAPRPLVTESSAKPEIPSAGAATATAKTSWTQDLAPVKAVDPESAPNTSKTETPVDSTQEAPVEPMAADLDGQGAKLVEEEQNQGGVNSVEITEANAGMGVAMTDSPMKNPQKTNKVAGSDVKVLPVDQDGEVQAKNLPPQLTAMPVRAAENQGTDLNLAFSNGNNQAAMNGSAPVLNVVDLPSLSDARMRAVDRAQDMVTLHAMRLVESNSDSLSVVIKPAVGTELSLELHLNSDGIRAQATVTRGDHQFLSQHWPELQQRLGQRGIHLASLDSGTDFSGNNNQFQQQQAEEAAQQASAFAEFASVSASSSGATARLAPVHDGWESWA